MSSMVNSPSILAKPKVRDCIEAWKSLTAQYPDLATLTGRNDETKLAPEEYLAHCRQVVRVQSEVRGFDFAAWLRKEEQKV
jgi:hypothetical protein